MTFVFPQPSDNDLPALERLRREAIRHHEQLRATGLMKRVELAEYRCRKGCLLLRVWQTPNGPEFYADTKHAVAFHTMAHGYIDVRGEGRNHASGPPRFGIPDIWAGRLDGHPAEGWLPLTCDHYHGAAQVRAVLLVIGSRTPGDPARIRIDAPTDT
jgi:hypothetical protein